MNRIPFVLCVLAAIGLSTADGWGQLLPDNTSESNRKMEEISHQNNSGPVSVPKEVKVVVETDKPRGVLMPWTLGVHSLVSDSHMTDRETIALLRAAGVTTLRYPGGRIADTFHWSTHSPSNWQGLNHPNIGYAPASNLGSFLQFMEQVGTAIFTVNYGSDLHGNGGGEPAEAAAWVAYANGDPSDTKSIGRDSAGNDWQTVGFWASLRASAPARYRRRQELPAHSAPSAVSGSFLGGWEPGIPEWLLRRRGTGRGRSRTLSREVRRQ